uniref:Reverse transcriptase domain-containing protein n=1 Tax=Tanacetum cinerariifolium TaxID=118510 RepID=A0A6L2K6K8_TANCI|nr:hypothetical protein [Tanacetum cinerariifolium]
MFIFSANCLNAGGNLLERSTQDVLTIIENKSKQTSAMTIAMTTMLKQFQATLPPAPVKAVEKIYVTCGGAHSYYQCLAAGGNTFLELMDNIQGYVSAAAVNYNQGNPGYRPLGFNRGNEQAYQAPVQQNQNVHLNELEKVRRMNEANMKAMQTQIDMVKNELRNEMKSSIQTSLSNQTNEIKNMMASLLQMNIAYTSGSGSLPSNIANTKGELKAITTRSSLVIDGPTVPTPSRSINSKVDERVEETFTDLDLAEYTIKVPPPSVQKYKLPSQKEFVVHQRDPHLHSLLHDNPLSGSTTYFSTPLLEEFVDELPSEYDDNLQFDIESDLKEIEFLLYQDKDSSLKDMIDQKDLANLADIFVDSVPEMFTDEHALDYSSPLIFDEYDDEFLEVKYDAGNVYDDPFDSKGEKIKESKLLIDELDLPCDFLPPSEYDSFIS